MSKAEHDEPLQWHWLYIPLVAFLVFAVGHASECFGYIQDWVEKKIRRHLMRARKRKGFGWTRWSRQWLYETLKLFSSYKVRWLQPKVAPAG
jgi:RNA-directed DNA polymerase